MKQMIDLLCKKTRCIDNTDVVIFKEGQMYRLRGVVRTDQYPFTITDDEGDERCLSFDFVEEMFVV